MAGFRNRSSRAYGPDGMQLLEDLIRRKVFTHKEIEKGLGRLQWATTCCPLTESLLQSCWAWKMACETADKPGSLIHSFAALLRELFRAPHKQNSPFGVESSGLK